MPRPALHPNKRFFNPEKDHLGVVQPDGTILLTISELDLGKSLTQTLPHISTVRSVYKLMKRNIDLLVFDCIQHNPEQEPILVGVFLNRMADGLVYAQHQFQTCTGAPCNACQFDMVGCLCQDPATGDDPTRMGVCNHSISKGMALSTIPLAN
jgi:hypothetical protein